MCFQHSARFSYFLRFYFEVSRFVRPYQFSNQQIHRRGWLDQLRWIYCYDRTSRNVCVASIVVESRSNRAPSLLLSISEVTDTSCVEILTDTVDISEWIEGAQLWSVDRQKIKDSLSSVRSEKVFQVRAHSGDASRFCRSRTDSHWTKPLRRKMLCMQRSMTTMCSRTTWSEHWNAVLRQIGPCSLLTDTSNFLLFKGNYKQSGPRSRAANRTYEVSHLFVETSSLKLVFILETRRYCNQVHYSCQWFDRGYYQYACDSDSGTLSIPRSNLQGLWVCSALSLPMNQFLTKIG